MVVRFELSPELERKLLDRARSNGQEASDYVKRLLERDLTGPSLDEALAPFREEVERSGVSDDALDALVEEAREASFRERWQKKTD